MAYAPPCSNQSKSSGHRVAHNAMRGFDASDRAGKGHGLQDEPPIDCHVGEIFCLFLTQGLKNMSHGPPSVELFRFEQKPRRPRCGARV